MITIQEKILVLHAEGLSNTDIAKAIGRSRGNVTYYLNKNGLSSNRIRHNVRVSESGQVTCVKCLIMKPLDLFLEYRKNSVTVRLSKCSSCRLQERNDRLNSSVDLLLADKYRRIKKEARIKEIIWELTREEFIDQFYQQNGKCFYTDTIMQLTRGVGNNFINNCSLDKIVPEEGYVSGNVVFCTTRVNAAKSNFSLKELKLWMPVWYQRLVCWGEKRYSSQLPLSIELRRHLEHS